MTRIFDLILSIISIIIFSPLMIPIIIIQKITGEHDVFYKQTRIGKNKVQFNVIKFATMLRNSPNLAGGLITLKNDPRLLPMGKFLRATKINELPQLINILIGQMSVVGYRPFAEAHYNLYSDEVKAAIGKIRPGLTGVGSIIFKNEEEILHSVEDREYLHDKVITPYKGQLEMWYVEHQNLYTYFMLIFLTVWAFIRPKSKAIYKIFKDLPPCPPELKQYLE